MRADLKRLKRETDSASARRRGIRRAAIDSPAPAARPDLAKPAIWIGGGSVVALGGGRWLTYCSEADRRQIDSMAVLPFVNGSGNPDTEYLTDGITETLINSLSQLPGAARQRAQPRVSLQGQGRRSAEGRATTSTSARSSPDASPCAATCSIVQSELVDVSNGTQLWGGQYNRPIADILAVQDEIASEIFDKLRVRLTGERTRSGRRGATPTTPRPTSCI